MSVTRNRLPPSMRVRREGTTRAALWYPTRIAPDEEAGLKPRMQS